MNAKYRIASLTLLLSVALLWMGCAGSRYQQSTGEMIDSAAITAKVKTALLDDPEVSGLAVDVDTFRGTVQLTGFVETEFQKQKAEQIAWGVEGVQQVQNKLSLKEELPPEQSGDAEVEVETDVE